MSSRLHPRCRFLDTVRGVAMLLVCVSHFGIYFVQLGDGRNAVTSAVASACTPMFVLLSGLLLGFLYEQERASFGWLSLKLMDRGLFLLLPTHLLIRMAHLAAFPTGHFFFITDAIGVCFLVGPWLVSTLSAASRVVLGVGLLALTWCLYFTWSPPGTFGNALQAIFVGRLPMVNGWLTFPLLPWLGFYILATPLGERLAVWKRSGPRLVTHLARAALLAAGLGIALFLLRRGQIPLIRTLLSARQKYPPSFPYLLLSTGVGLALTAIVAGLEQRGLLKTIVSALAMVGRSSLVVFIAQYVIYDVGFFLLRLPASRLWPTYLLASIALVFAIAKVWDRYFGNRYLTVGLPFLIHRSTRPAPAAPRAE